MDGVLIKDNIYIYMKLIYAFLYRFYYLDKHVSKGSGWASNIV